jgi:hypothetical protein
VFSTLEPCTRTLNKKSGVIKEIGGSIGE